MSIAATHKSLISHVENEVLWWLLHNVEKIAIITGAAGGIGTAAAHRFAKEGACVVMIDCREGPLVELARSIGVSGSYIVADVTNPDDVQRYVRTTVERHGGVDVLLNNAGIIGLIKPIEEYPIDVFDSVLSVNVRGVWLGPKYVMPGIAKRGGGSIVITASIAGVRGTPGGWACDLGFGLGHEFPCAGLACKPGGGF